MTDTNLSSSSSSSSSSSASSFSYSSFKTFIPSFPRPSPGIAHIEIFNPSKLNALSPSAFAELPPLFSLLSRDPNIRCIVLSGSGSQAFSAGLDLAAAVAPDSPFSYAQSAIITLTPRSPGRQKREEDGEGGGGKREDEGERPDPARVAFRLKGHIEGLQEAVNAIAQCSKPVIAALHGHCLGAGLDLACCADIRLCSPSTTFSVREVHIGLAADLGVLSRLSKVVGSGSWVKDICMTGRIFGAEEARREGLVSWMGTLSAGPLAKGGDKEGKEEVTKKAFKLAEEIAALSPVAVQGTKELLDHSIDHSVEESVKYSAVWNMAMLQTSDLPRAIAATRGKRKPTFSKL